MHLLLIFQLSRSSYYYLKNISEYDKYEAIKQEILEISRKHKNRYGYRRITQELHNKGFIINHKTVNKLMRALEIECVQIKSKYKSYRGSESETAPNIIARNFQADKSNVKWTTDITEFSLLGKKLYLSPILDMYNGEIISYTIDYHPDLQLVMDMLNKALNKVKKYDGLIIHSDQGWHYQHKHYRHTLKKHKIIQSMSRKGNCLDNSIMESFFGTLKNEFFYNNTFTSIEEFKIELNKYINYYNNERIKYRLNGLSPVKYRTQTA